MTVYSDTLTTKLVTLNAQLKANILATIPANDPEYATVSAAITEHFNLTNVAAVAAIATAPLIEIERRMREDSDIILDIIDGQDLPRSGPGSAAADLSEYMGPVQDVIPAFMKPEIPVVSNKFTSVKDQPPGTNALAEDYPETYGKIDEILNWWKSNKATGYSEAVHNSGAYFKIDGDGNASAYIPKGFKLIVGDDLLINSIGSTDIHSIKDLSILANKVDIEARDKLIGTSVTTELKSSGNTSIKSNNLTLNTKSALTSNSGTLNLTSTTAAVNIDTTNWTGGGFLLNVPQASTNILLE